MTCIHVFNPSFFDCIIDDISRHCRALSGCSFLVSSLSLALVLHMDWGQAGFLARSLFPFCTEHLLLQSRFVSLPKAQSLHKSIAKLSTTSLTLQRI